MKMIGKYSVASALRWLLGFVNVFVMIGAVATILVFLFTLIVPSFGAGLIDGLKGAHADPNNTLQWTGRLTFLGAAMACGFTWWIINRLRRILLSVNQGDAFEFANVKRLQGVGAGPDRHSADGAAAGLRRPAEHRPVTVRLRLRPGILAGHSGGLHSGRGVPAGVGHARRTADHGLRSARHDHDPT